MTLNKLTYYFPLVLLLFHLIGLVIYLQPDWLGVTNGLQLTWLNLTLCALLVFLAENYFKRAFISFLVIGIGGFLIEYIGIATGYLFGDYYYGEVLGAKLLGVPLTISLNWIVIVLASTNIARLINGGKWGRAVLAGILCTILDFLIEPVAVQYQFWFWENESIPLSNYLTWFIFSTAFAYIYLIFSDKMNKTAAWTYLIWFMFFAILNAF